jgi:hypothetical protein
MNMMAAENQAGTQPFSPDFEWRFFPHYIIRSTGFPFEWLEALAFPRTSDLARQIVQMERSLDAQTGVLLETAERSGGLPRKSRQKLSRFLQRREKGAADKLAELELTDRNELLDCAATWDRLAKDYQALLALVPEMFEQELAEKREKLRELVKDRKYQEAVYLSSPDMYANNVPKYLNYSPLPDRNAAIKRMERRFFHYVQRLCGKNETSSFFGPLNYGSIDDADPSYLDAHFQTGDIIRHREVFLAFWAIKRLAEAIKQDDQLRPHLPVHLHPMVEAVPEKGGLHLHNSGKTVTVGRTLAALLREADGTKSLPELLAHLDEKERLAVEKPLSHLLQAGLLKQELHVPSTMGNPLPYVIEQVAALPPSDQRQMWLERLRGWEAWLTRMSAEQDLQARIELISEGEARFTEQTGESARRGSGSLYADRYIFYEETKGHIERFVMGRRFHEKLCKDLRGALELSAYYGYEQWLHAQRLGKEVFDTISNGGDPVPYYTFVNALRDRYPDSLEPFKPQAVEEIEELVRIKAADSPHCVELSSAALPIREVTMPLYSLPDLFIASESIDAMAKGDFQVVLGKLHSHVLVPNWMTVFYPNRETLREDLCRELKKTAEFRQLVAPEVVRRNKGFYDFPGRAMQFAELSLKKGDDVIPMYDLEVVLKEDGTLGLRSVKSGEEIRLYIQLADQVTYLPFMLFALPALTHMPISLGDHTPRIVIDGAVYQRERWECEGKAVAELLDKDDAAAFLNVFRFKEKQGMPDVVYIRGLSERKPYVVDFRNFFCVEMLRSIVQNNERLLIEEMLPTPGQLWLNSEAGRYSCEFRMNVWKTRTENKGGGLW